ncbi:hypothetical protein [Micromonospora sp. NPDC050200]|uniref:hypothetical protein n=1 Tax=Micromonospora sp. NPDC050200 TaxID=3155664 RepID=UPI0033FC953F
MSDSPIWDKIHQPDADIAALQPTQKGWLPKWLDEHLKKWVAANNQLIYESTQAFKVDPSAINISPELVQVNARGVTVLGVEVSSFRGSAGWRILPCPPNTDGISGILWPDRQSWLGAGRKGYACLLREAVSHVCRHQGETARLARSGLRVWRSANPSRKLQRFESSTRHQVRSRPLTAEMRSGADLVWSR